MQDSSTQYQRVDNGGQPLPSDEQQSANAAGENANEQGQASFVTGSTTGGGSNYGQGSHQLGGESYRQGDTTTSGSNYSNEAGKLGTSSTGTSAEGSSSKLTGAAASGYDAQDMTGTNKNARESDSGASADEDRGISGGREALEEGDRRDTDLEKDSGLANDSKHTADGHTNGSWSHSTIQNDD